jgi:hypothetical protein
MLALVKLKNPNLLQSLAKKNNSSMNMNMNIGTTMMLSRMNRTNNYTRWDDLFVYWFFYSFIFILFCICEINANYLLIVITV